MPTSKFPEVKNHLVYIFHANRYPVYVGHGKLGRLSDRPRFIDSLVRLHPDFEYHKWTLHGKVVARLWELGVKAYFDQFSGGHTKAAAKAEEDLLTRKLVNEGFIIANDQGNANVRPVEQIVGAVVGKEPRWYFLEAFTPSIRYSRESIQRRNRG